MIFSNDMRFALKAPEVRVALLLHFDKLKPDSCENCSGLNFVYFFLGTAGPYDSIVSTSTPAKWDEKIKKWWLGGTFSFPCPVCSGG